MLYFAYGSNLNHHQMKNIRCFGSKYIKFYSLLITLIFFWFAKSKIWELQISILDWSLDVRTMETPILPFLKKGSKVAGAIWDITKEHEKILDSYEQFPDIYKKEYFYLDGKKIMFYIMKEYFIKDPPKSYVDVINDGYKDCNIDLRINYRF